MLKRDKTQKTKIKQYLMEVYKNDINQNLQWKIEIETIYYLYINDKGFVNVNVKQTFVDEYKYINSVIQ